MVENSKRNLHINLETNRTRTQTFIVSTAPVKLIFYNLVWISERVKKLISYPNFSENHAVPSISLDANGDPSIDFTASAARVEFTKIKLASLISKICFKVSVYLTFVSKL